AANIRKWTRISPHSTTHPLTHSPIYKTGDLARWLFDGNIEFLGRIDRQVKIRGFRIELGEIQSQLTLHPDTADAVVITGASKTGGANDTYICAYVVMKDPAVGEKPVTPDFKAYLAGKLPYYMVPPYVMTVADIPLTTNGKIDRDALPNPVSQRRIDDCVPAGSPVEKQLVDIWQEILGIRPIGITDHFFEVGGDSIKAIQVCARLRKDGFDLKIHDLFQHPQIKEEAKQAKKIHRQIYQGIV
ncbi:MAG: non-ribosomal peptide synthetase, partial [bacterium]|nr:non-ribosomal peptide synthetase [bacterium]